MLLLPRPNEERQVMTLNVRKGLSRLFVVFSSLWIIVVIVLAVKLYHPEAVPDYPDKEIEQAIRTGWGNANPRPHWSEIDPFVEDWRTDRINWSPREESDVPRFRGLPSDAIIMSRIGVVFDNITTTVTVRKNNEIYEEEIIVLPVGLAEKKIKDLIDIVRGSLIGAHHKTEKRRVRNYILSASIAAFGPPIGLLLLFYLGTWIVAGFKPEKTV